MKKETITAIIISIIIGLGLWIYIAQEPIDNPQGTETAEPLIKKNELESIKDCDEDTYIFENDAKYDYVLKGVDGDKCEIKMYKKNSNISAAICYVPMTEYNKIYNLAIEYKQNMDNPGFNKAENQQKAKKIISQYCDMNTEQ